jgi:hypothetical protein
MRSWAEGFTHLPRVKRNFSEKPMALSSKTQVHFVLSMVSVKWRERQESNRRKDETGNSTGPRGLHPA